MQVLAGVHLSRSRGAAAFSAAWMSESHDRQAVTNMVPGAASVQTLWQEAGADHLVGDGFGAHDAREAHVRYLGLPVAAQQDVGALEVHVDDAPAVQEVHAACNVQGNAPAPAVIRCGSAASRYNTSLCISCP